MKKYSIVVLSGIFSLCLYTQAVFGQDKTKIKPVPACKDTLLQVVAIPMECQERINFHEDPKFTHGNEAEFISKNIKYPRAARRKGITGTVRIIVTISSEGKMVDMQLASTLPKGCSEEALRVVKLMGDNWKPGKLNGVPVTSRKEINVQFSLDKTNKD